MPQVLDGSVVSSVTDKYGFMGGEAGELAAVERGKVSSRTYLALVYLWLYLQVDLEIIRRRESKWVEMMGSWDTYMMRSEYFIYCIPGDTLLL